MKFRPLLDQLRDDQSKKRALLCGACFGETKVNTVSFAFLDIFFCLNLKFDTFWKMFHS
jgi:hypothetical protein